MAATGSDEGGRRRGLSSRPRRLSLRLRLTLLYGACFLVGCAAVLAVTYLLVAKDTSSQTRHLRVAGSKIQLPRAPLTVVPGDSGAASSVAKGGTMMIEQIHISPSGKEIITWARSSSISGATSPAANAPQRPGHSDRDDWLRYTACVRADGVPDYPSPGPSGGGRPITVKAEQVTVGGHVLSEPWSVVHAAGDRCQKFLYPLYGPRYTVAQMAKIRAAALAMSKCMRADGIDYPNVKVVRGPGGHGVAETAPPVGVVGSMPQQEFNADDKACARPLNRTIAEQGTSSTATGIASLLQTQMNVIVERANGALTTERSRSLRVLLTWSGVVLGVMAVISILLGWLLGGRALRPLRAMTSRARRITEENLHERLAVDTQEDELGDLAGTFDGVLARLQQAFEAQKRFVANASHELRTPVTLERVLLETALAAPDADADELRHACERVLASNEQQQRMIEALLTLARSQGGTDVDARLDLADLAQDALTLREHRLQDIIVAADLHPAPLHGDPALLERLVSNLIDNAITHNRPEDGWMTIETGHDGTGGSWLRVSNSGAEVPESMISEIFEPFRRVTGERTATATGLGLGLSIVRAISDVHGASVDAAPIEGGGLRVEVRF